MTAVEWLRPKEASARFGISTTTLATWAEEGRIAWSQPDGERHAIWYDAATIQAVIDAGAHKRTPAPAQPERPPLTVVSGDWREMPPFARGSR